MLRKVRYAAVVAFALLTLALVALWVRSHDRWDSIEGSAGGTLWSVRSQRGNVLLVASALPQPRPKVVTKWTSKPVPAWLQREESISAFALNIEPLVISLSLPHWFLAALSLGLAAIFAFKRTWRISLSGLLWFTAILAAILTILMNVF
jgi:hypothetical protein